MVIEEVERLECDALHDIYELVEQMRGDELAAAQRQTKVAFTRLRGKLAQIAKLCKTARKEFLIMRDGEKKKEEKEEGMEKYGVVVEKDDTKTASDDAACPKCGDATEKHGTVKKCDSCGTEPFEKE